MSVIRINSSNYENEVLKSDRRVLIDCYADWCSPCRMVSPIVDRIAEEHPEYKVCKVNVDEQPEIAASFKVMSIPALFVMEKGKIICQSVGARSEAQILAMLSKGSYE
ncbi:MAG: thioredoxin [Huintestinicola sp.]